MLQEERTVRLSLIVIVFMVLLLMCGCGGGGGGGDDGEAQVSFAEAGDWAVGNDSQIGGYFKVIDNQIYNLTFNLDQPSSYGSCPTVFGGVVIRPGESEPFMEFANTLEAEPTQKMIYYGPVPIDSEGSIHIEESITPFTCTQSFSITGQFQDREYIIGTWEYSIDGESASGSWWANLLTDDPTAETATLATASIKIDGDRSDWQGITPVISDPEGDEDPDADFTATDIGAVYLAKDDNFLYMMITLHDGMPQNDLNVLYSIGFMAYPPFGGGVPGDRYAGCYLNYPPDGQMVINVSEVAVTGFGWEDIAEYESEYAAVGNNFIEYKVLLDDIGSVDGKYLKVSVSIQDKDSDGLALFPFSDVTEAVVKIDLPAVD